MKTNHSEQKKGKHLTFGERCRIETLISEAYSMRYIAECVGCSPSTVSREINSHAFIQKTRANDCLNSRDCTKRGVCSILNCRKKCSTCNVCKKYCEDYVKALCDKLADRGLCNGCMKRSYCHYDKRFYKADFAEKEYREMLVGRRDGFDLTGEEIETINSQVSPLVRKASHLITSNSLLGTLLE